MREITFSEFMHKLWMDLPEESRSLILKARQDALAHQAATVVICDTGIKILGASVQFKIVFDPKEYYED